MPTKLGVNGQLKRGFLNKTLPNMASLIATPNCGESTLLKRQKRKKVMERSPIEMFEKRPVTLFIYATYALFSAMMVLEKRRRSGDIIGLLRENWHKFTDKNFKFRCFANRIFGMKA